jgi:hypothetical protein
LLVVATAALAQDSAPVVDRVVDRANHQNPYFSAQGLKALKAHGDAALPALERFIARRSVHALAPLVVEWLGELPDERARTILRDVVRNRAFPWRPQAARSLARAPAGSDLDLLVGLATDPLAAVREAALLALGKVASQDPAARPAALKALDAGLADPLFEPRLAAAEALLQAGQRSPLPVLLDALRVERRFFDLDFGVIARRRAWAALEPLVGPGIAFDPSLPPERNEAAIAAIAAKVGAGESRSQAASAPLQADVGDAVFGIEIRSCRAGDQWVRLTAGGDLVLGHYDLAIRKLRGARAEEILGLIRDLSSEEKRDVRLDEGAYFGRPGCDFEKWYLPEESGLLRVTVGLEGRPEILRRIEVAVAAAVEEAFGPAAGEEFRDRALPFGRPVDED